MRILSYIVESERDGSPVWSILAGRLHISQALMRSAKIHEGAILVDGIPSRLTPRVHTGQVVSIDVSDSWRDCLDHSTEPQPGDLDIVYEDEDLLVINKRAGKVVHPCPGHRDETIGNHVMAYLLAKDPDCKRLYPAHRLDIGTTGLLVYAKNAYVRNRVQDFMDMTKEAEGQLDGASPLLALGVPPESPSRIDPACSYPAEGVFRRTYLALCCGTFEKSEGVVDAPIERISMETLRRAVLPTGKEAVTYYQVLAEISPNMTLVALRLVTGRTHQIRVHMELLGHPLVGDALYDSPLLMLDHPALHSWRLEMTHPVTGKLLRLEAPLPSDMAALIPPGVLGELPSLV